MYIMYKNLFILVLIIILVLSSPFVYAQEKGEGNSKTFIITPEMVNEKVDIPIKSPDDLGISLTSRKTDAISRKYGFTLREELEIGYKGALKLLKIHGYYNNAKVNEYVNEVGSKIAQTVSRRPDITYQFFVLNTKIVNAISCPGGYIFVTKGALKKMSDESELAGVLAHEIAHIEEGHGLETMRIHPGVINY